ncbi:MAG: SMC family ATPase, partial [Dehalococcoidia bacterium]|nr:SMC family ATPase [Dehalococcoidia bacterium]
RALETLRSASAGAAARQDLVVKAIEEEMRSFGEKRQRLQEAAARAGQIEHDLSGAIAREAAISRRLTEFNGILEHAAETEAAAVRYQVLDAVNRRLTVALQQLDRLRQELLAVERQLDKARTQLQIEERELQQESQRLSEMAGAGPTLERQRREAEADMVQLADEQPKIEQSRSQIETIAQQMGALRHHNETIVQQGKELRSRVEQLKKPGAVGVCPLCGTELGPHGHEKIIREYQMELEQQRGLFRGNERRLKELLESAAQLNGAMKEAEAAVNSRRASAQSALQLAAQGMDSARQAADALPRTQERLAAVRLRLSSGEYAADSRRRQGELAAAVEALGYSEAEHKLVHAEHSALAGAPGEAQKLAEALRRGPEDQAELVRMVEAKKRWQAQLDDERSRIAALKKDLDASPDRSQDLATSKQVLIDLQQQVRSADQEIGRASEQIAASIEAQRRVQALRQETAALAWERQAYDELALAFGRRGLQAMLIETALPELEEETNRLLSRLTDNGLSIRLVTQRQGRAGNLIETLDIIIADETGGGRPYELYSGGEAFRINFALRVALSRLLARRSGAPLQTLIIDEGFGTQDTAGREKLVEAIGAIADDFQRVLVITHIDEMKDAFPVRIEVSKTASGAQARVLRM